MWESYAPEASAAIEAALPWLSGSTPAAKRVVLDPEEVDMRVRRKWDKIQEQFPDSDPLDLLDKMFPE